MRKRISKAKQVLVVGALMVLGSANSAFAVVATFDKTTQGLLTAVDLGTAITNIGLVGGAIIGVQAVKYSLNSAKGMIK